MSSILTNTSAMVALQTLKGINTSLAKTQDEISTGKTVGSAKDNAAVWSISKVMEADVSGFKAISDSLSLGESTVAVARNAAETVTDLLKQMKTAIIAAQGDNQDRATLQTDIEKFTAQIESVVSAAQFNGLNLVDGKLRTESANGVAGSNILSSLDRSGSSVTAAHIALDAQNLSTAKGETVTYATAAGGKESGTILGASSETTDAPKTLTLTIPVATAEAVHNLASEAEPGALGAPLSGDVLTVTIDGTEASYTVQTGDDAEAIAAGLKAAIDDSGLTGLTVVANATDAAGVLTVVNTEDVEKAISFSAVRDRGGLADLADLDVTDQEGAEEALTKIESLINYSINSAAAFGSIESRITTQSSFVSSLIDSLQTGIGTLVDADMEEASARLTALQTQQQLAIQSLTIANQAPQNILALFR